MQASPAGFEGILWFLDVGRWIVFERLHDRFDRAFELRVAAFGHERRVVNYRNIGIDAVVFDNPISVRAVNAECRDRYRAAVDQSRRAGNADEAAPGAGADKRAKMRLLKVEWKTVASRTAPAIDQHCFGAGVGYLRPRPVMAIAHAPVVED